MRVLGRDLFQATGSGESFSGLSSNGDELNLYDADRNLIQSIELDAAEEGFSNTWGFVNGNYTDLGIVELGEQGAVQSITDGSENRLANPAFWEEDLALGLISLDVSSAGHVEGMEVVFPTIEVDLDSLCSQVAAGDLTSDAFQMARESANVLPGDADMNGQVDFADFLVLSANFSTAGTFSNGDFDCNGNVAFADFLTLSSNFGRSVAGSGSLSVPEPQICLHWLAGLFIMGLTRRKKR